jgi:hypothetical protein
MSALTARLSFDSVSQLAGLLLQRSLVAGLSPRRPGFAPGSIHVGIVVDKVALGQVFLRVLRFYTVIIIIPPSLSKLISGGQKTSYWSALR